MLKIARVKDKEDLLYESVTMNEIAFLNKDFCGANKKNYLSIVVFLCIFASAQTAHIDCLSEEYETAIRQQFPDIYTLHSVTFETDFDIDTQELLLLTNLHIGKYCSTQDLVLAGFYLEQKGRFNSIDMDCEVDEDGLKILFKLLMAR